MKSWQITDLLLNTVLNLGIIVLCLGSLLLIIGLPIVMIYEAKRDEDNNDTR